VKTFSLLMIVAALLTAGCHRSRPGGNSGVQTETIAPANAQPAPTGTDALTQTTEVEDSRSEADGGVTSPAATSTAKAPAKAKAPVKKKHK
jgi:hypothetical protein